MNAHTHLRTVLIIKGDRAAEFLIWGARLDELEGHFVKEGRGDALRVYEGVIMPWNQQDQIFIRENGAILSFRVTQAVEISQAGSDGVIVTHGRYCIVEPLRS